MVVVLIKSRRHCIVSHFLFLCIDNLGLITYFSDKPFYQVSSYFIGAAGTRMGMLKTPDKVNLQPSKTKLTKRRLFVTVLSSQFWASVALERKHLQESCTATLIS